MTELERALLHIKTRADAWAVKEIEKALSQEPCDDCIFEEGSKYCIEHCPHEAKANKPCDDVISRDAVLEGLKGCICEEWIKTLFATMVKQLPPGTQKPSECGDAISREELLKAIDTWDKFGYTETGCFVRITKEIDNYVPYVHLEDVITAIQKLPPVTQKSGFYCDTCEIGNPCLYCKHEFEPQESEDK